MATDAVTYLPEDVLVKVDRASMAAGLEVRSPFLDHRLLELALSAHPNWIGGSEGGKLPLKRLYSDQLPTAVFARSKMGFGVPLKPWFRGKFGQIVADRLLDPKSAVAGILMRSSIEHLLLSHELHQRDESGRLWHLLVLHAWFDYWRPTVEEEPTAPPTRA
jgi:asparagine synthase (glutamine-hydrolysing)